MRENNPWMYATDSRMGEEREERYVHFMNACWKTTTKTAQTGTGRGKKQLGEKWPIGKVTIKGGRDVKVDGGRCFGVCSQPPDQWSPTTERKAVLLVEQRI
mgnify:FL=1|jgi:hypothetical protein